MITGETEEEVRREGLLYQLTFDAEAAIAEHNAKATATAERVDNVTLGEACEKYLFERVQKRVREKTFESYVGVLRRYIAPTIGSKRLRDVKVSDICAAFERLSQDGYSMSVLSKFLIVLSKFYAHAVDEYSYVEENLAKDEDVKDMLKSDQKTRRMSAAREGSQKVKALTMDKLQTFVNAAKEYRLRYVYILMATTGLRPGEAIGLRWQGVDLTNLRIRVTGDAHRVCVYDPKTRAKTGTQIKEDSVKSESSIRWVYLHPEHRRLFAAQRHLLECERMACQKKSYTECGYVFPSSVGTLLEQRNLNRTFQKIRAKSPELQSYTPHGLRHTFATLCDRNGMHYGMLKKLLGHATVTDVTSIYTEASDAEVEQNFHQHMDSVIAEILSWC